MSEFTVLDVLVVLERIPHDFTDRMTDFKIRTANAKDDGERIKQIIDAVLGHTDKPHVTFAKEAHQ